MVSYYFESYLPHTIFNNRYEVVDSCISTSNVLTGVARLPGHKPV